MIKLHNLGRVLGAQFSKGEAYAADWHALNYFNYHWPGVIDVLADTNAFERRLVHAAHNAELRQFVFLGHDFPTTTSPVYTVCSSMWRDTSIVVVESDEDIRAAWQKAKEDWFPGPFEVSACDRWAADQVVEDLPRCGIDLTRPVCFVVGNAAMVATAADGVQDQLARYRAALAPRSRLALSHLTTEHAEDSTFAAAIEELERLSDAVAISRTRAEVLALFGAWPLVTPGVCPAPAWRPDHALSVPERRAPIRTWCGVAAKPGSASRAPWHPGLLA